MTLNERLLDFLDGALAPDDEAELLHTLSVSPEKRGLLRNFMNDGALLARDRQTLQVPYEAERALWAKLDRMIPMPAGEAEEAIPLSAISAARRVPASRMFSRMMIGAVGAVALLVGMGAGYIAGSAGRPNAPLTIHHQEMVASVSQSNGMQPFSQVTGPMIRSTSSIERMNSSERANARSLDLSMPSFASIDVPQPILGDVPIAQAQSVPVENESNKEFAVLDARPTGPVQLHHIGGDGAGITPLFPTSIAEVSHGSFLDRFEFAIDESFGRQFPNSIATNVSLPLVTNSSLGTYFQILPHSNLLWVGAAYGTANITRKNLFTRGGNQIDPLQEVLASDTAHAQTSYFAGYLQFRLPAFASADLTFTGGYGYATLGRMMMGEIGLHYDVARQVGLNLGLRLLRFSYDLSGEKAAAIQSGNGSLVVPAGVAAASPSYNTELTTGLFFHF